VPSPGSVSKTAASAPAEQDKHAENGDQGFVCLFMAASHMAGGSDQMQAASHTERTHDDERGRVMMSLNRSCIGLAGDVLRRDREVSSRRERIEHAEMYSALERRRRQKVGVEGIGGAEQKTLPRSRHFSLGATVTLRRVGICGV
jgi:hypothetical protein